MDFSETAMKALHTAIAIANKSRGNIKIVHIISKSSSDPEKARKSANHKMAELVSTVMNEYKVDNGVVDSEVLEGVVADQLTEAMTEASIVVMGSHGVSGISKNWIGGNAYKMICNCKVPVLLIRPDMEYDESLQTCVVPVNINKSSRQVLPKVADVLSLLGMKVMVMGIQGTTLSYVYNRITSAMKQVVGYIKGRGLEVTCTANIISKDYITMLLSTIESKGADLVTVDVTNSGVFIFDRLRPDLTTLINYSKCPVLVVPNI